MRAMRTFVHAKTFRSCPTLCDSMACSPPGSSVHGILQARTLQWVAMPSSRGSSWPRERTCISYVSCTGRQVLYHYRHLKTPNESHWRIWKIHCCVNRVSVCERGMATEMVIVLHQYDWKWTMNSWKLAKGGKKRGKDVINSKDRNRE